MEQNKGIDQTKTTESDMTSDYDMVGGLTECNDCSRVWDGNAQCPCSLVGYSSDESDDSVDSVASSVNDMYAYTLDPNISPWLPMNSFEEGTPLEDYMKRWIGTEDLNDPSNPNEPINQNEPINPNEPINQNEPSNPNEPINQNEPNEAEVPTDMKYKNCMDEWMKKEKQKYSDTPRSRKIVFSDIEYRADPYDYGLYTREAFYEYYGSDEVWTQQHPQKCLLRDHIHHIAENYDYLLPRHMNILMKHIANTYS